MSMVIMFSYLVILAPAREHIENTMLRYAKPPIHPHLTSLRVYLFNGIFL